MTWYREIEVLQEPFDLSPDGTGRAKVAFNISVVKRYSNTFLEEITKILMDASVGVANSNIFTTSMKDIPDGDGPYLSIVETGGTFPERTHNSVSVPAYLRPTAQIVVRAGTYSAARTMARAAYNALAAVRNSNIVP